MFSQHSFIRRSTMLSPLCACVQRYCAPRNVSTLVSPLFSPSLSSNNPVSSYLMRNAATVLFTTYRSYSKPALKKQEVSVVEEKKKQSPFVEDETKLPLIVRLARKYIHAVPRSSIERFKLLKASSYMYEQLVDEINVEEFFREFDLPDTFASWFVVMELHVYVLAARLFKHEACGVGARDMLTDAFWNDVQYRSQKLGHRASLHRKKQLCILGYQFQAAFYGYDEGVQANDKVLAAIVWRRFFAFECNDAQKIERVVKYIRVQLDYLNSVRFDDIVFNQQVLTIPLKSVQLG